MQLIERNMEAMMDLERIEHVKRLLAAGKHSQRQISKWTGVSRGTVGKIAKGNYHLPEAPEFKHAGKVHARCPECGHRVLLPCLYCHLMRLRGAHVEQSNQREKNPLAIDLNGEELERYKAIHEVVKEQVRQGIRWKAVRGMVAFAEMYPDEFRDRLLEKNQDSVKRKKVLSGQNSREYHGQKRSGPKVIKSFSIKGES